MRNRDDPIKDISKEIPSHVTTVWSYVTSNKRERERRGAASKEEKEEKGNAKGKWSKEKKKERRMIGGLESRDGLGPFF